MQHALLNQQPLLIAALHMPTRDVLQGPLSIAWLEDYVASNLEVFSKGGIQTVKIQDEFSTPPPPTLPEVIALMAAMGCFAREAFPDLDLGIIIEAHDPIAPLAIAHACGASFVRIKVFGGAMVKAGGILRVAVRKLSPIANGWALRESPSWPMCMTAPGILFPPNLSNMLPAGRSTTAQTPCSQDRPATIMPKRSSISRQYGAAARMPKTLPKCSHSLTA